MKKVAVALTALVLAVGIAACATPTTVTRVNSDQFLVCDTGGNGGCSGPNPGHGISKSCPKVGRAINKIEELSTGGLMVTCGDPLKQSKTPRQHR